MQTPTLIFLNGTSSAGKTSIALELQKVMNEPYLYFSADVFRPMLPPYKEGLDWVVNDILDRKNFGFYGCLAAMVSEGNYIIADQALFLPYMVQCCAQALTSHRAFLVGVRCPCEITQQRERDRGDRIIGIAKEQFDQVHQHSIYDYEVDTSLLRPEESAAQIAHHVYGNEPRAFSLPCDYQGHHSESLEKHGK